MPRTHRAPAGGTRPAPTTAHVVALAASGAGAATRGRLDELAARLAIGLTAPAQRAVPPAVGPGGPAALELVVLAADADALLGGTRDSPAVPTADLAGCVVFTVLVGRWPEAGGAAAEMRRAALAAGALCPAPPLHLAFAHDSDRAIDAYCRFWAPAVPGLLAGMWSPALARAS